MSTVVSLLLLVLLAGIVYLLYREYRRSRSSRRPLYTEALMDLLDDRKDEALAKLRETVNADSENVDAYLRLAQLLMERGEIERASRIYQTLAVRRNLSARDEQKVLLALAREHLRAQRVNRAISLLEQVSEHDPRDITGRELLLFVYLQTERWDEVKALLKDLVKLQKDRHRAALYLTETGARLYAKEPETAAGYFAQALDLDGKSVPALIYAGDALYAQGKMPEAVAKWKQVLGAHPDLSFMVRERIEKAFYESGKYEEMVKIYEDLITKTPDDASLYVPLARIYAKKGDAARAQAVLNRIPAKAQDDPVVRLLKVELHLGLSDTGAALKELAQVETRLGTQAFRCNHCGHAVAGEFAWHCPQCGAWESFQRERRPDR
jgi:lipopolysaccharide biosynthesis regulator YciM